MHGPGLWAAPHESQYLSQPHGNRVHMQPVTSWGRFAPGHAPWELAGGGLKRLLGYWVCWKHLHGRTQRAWVMPCIAGAWGCGFLNLCCCTAAAVFCTHLFDQIELCRVQELQKHCRTPGVRAAGWGVWAGCDAGFWPPAPHSPGQINPKHTQPTHRFERIQKAQSEGATSGG